MIKKLALIPLLLSTAVFAQPVVELDEKADSKINLLVNFNKTSTVSYFEAANDMVGISVVSESSFNKEIYYTNKNGDFIIKGVMIDAKSHKNLSQQHYNDIKLIVSEDNVKDFTKGTGITQGNGSNEVFAFIDVNCPACHNAWAKYQEILADETNDLKVTWVPVGWLSQDSKIKANMLLGEKKEDQLALLKSYMKRARALPENEKMQLGQELTTANEFILKSRQIQGVPFIVSKVENTWDASPGIPGEKHFALLKSLPKKVDENNAEPIAMNTL